MEQPEPAPHDVIVTRSLEVPAALRPYVRALIGADAPCGPLPLAVAPHEWLTLAVQIGRDSHCLEQKDGHGRNTFLTGIRQWTGSYTGRGDCITVFALLTPLGSVQLLESRRLDAAPRIGARIDELLDDRVTRPLESGIALASTLQAKVHAFAAWLEQRVFRQRSVAPGAVRAARAAMRVCDVPSLGVDALAREHHVSRRQLERDFERWVGVAPHHLAQVARVQRVSRRATAGGSMADIAADVGFADQAHMCRAVRSVTGLTPRQFTRASTHPLGSAFRRATQGSTVYL